jgi:hypothetical protein
MLTGRTDCSANAAQAVVLVPAAVDAIDGLQSLFAAWEPRRAPNAAEQCLSALIHEYSALKIPCEESGSNVDGIPRPPIQANSGQRELFAWFAIGQSRCWNSDSLCDVMRCVPATRNPP